MLMLLITLILAIGAGVGLAIVSAPQAEDGTKKPALRPGITAAVVVFLLLLALNSFAVVQSGSVGVVTRLGAVTGRVVEQGLSFKAPFIEDVEIFDVRTQKDQSDAAAASKDLQEVKATIAVNYHVNEGEAQQVFQQIGTSYKERVIDPSIQEAFKATTAQYTAEELITKREDVKTKALNTLRGRLLPFHIIVDGFNIVNFDFSAEFNKAIESKQVAQQDAEKAKQVLEKTKIEAQSKIAEAEGNARAQELQKQSLTAEYVNFLAVQKWDGKLPTYTGGALPFINLK